MGTLSILNFVQTLFSQIYQGILGIVEGGLSVIFSAFGQDFTVVVNAFVQDLNSFGILMPLVVVAIFGGTGAAIYLELGTFRTILDVD